MTIFKYIKGSRFFPTYAPGIKQYRNKLNGHNGRGKAVTFTEKDLKVIKAGLKRMIRENATLLQK